MKKKILSALLAAALAVSAAALPGSVRAAEPISVNQGEMELWYDEPASQGQNIGGRGEFGTTDEDNTWQQQTLPIGNSRMGANVYGEIGTEHLTFNHKTLWNGGPSESRKDYNGGNYDRAAEYKEIVQLYKDGNDGQANNMANQYLVGKRAEAGYGAYQSWGDIYLDFGFNANNATGYRRSLNLDTAVAEVDFTYNNTKMHREYFATHVDNVIAMKLTADGSEKLNFTVSFPVDNDTTNELGKNVTTKASGNKITVAGSLRDNGMRMNGQLKVVPQDGSVQSEGTDKLKVSGASTVYIYVAADTDYQNVYPKYRTGETAQELADSVTDVIDSASKKGYETVKEAHLKDYKELYGRMALNLGQTVPNSPTDEVLTAYKNNSASAAEQRYLEVLLFQYGRYMTIASSRAGDDLPSNLQGLWQNRVGNHQRVPWGSDYHMNVNLQMNYWPTYCTNLAECAEPLVDYVNSLMEPGAVTAKMYFGVDGAFTAHTQNTPFGWTCPGWEFKWGWSPAALPWILQNCWEYYEYTGDVNYMRDKLYPMLKASATLYDNILFEKGGRLVSAPAYSPEHGPVTAGNTYEQSLIWQLYEDASTAAEILGDTAQAEAWRATQEQLKPIEIGTSGQIKEWYHETYLGSVGDRNHRHMSHLLGLFPGDLISVDNPEYMNAAIVSLKDRGYTSTGWGMGQRINAWARTGDGETAHTLIRNLFRDGIYPNLWDAHPPFQIDGNFGYTSGVAEMLMQSNMGYINLLPSLPKAWANGSVRGMLARGNVEVSMSWAEGKLTSATLIPKNGGAVSVKNPFGNNEVQVMNAAGEITQLTPNEKGIVTFDSKAGGSYTLTAKEAPVIPELNVQATRAENGEVKLTWDAKPGVTYTITRRELP